MAGVETRVQFVDPRAEGRRAAETIVRLAILCTLTISSVVPHSFQLLNIVLLAGTFVLCLAVMKRDAWFDRVLPTYLVGAALTAFYIWVGYSNGAPRAASNQTLLVYVVSPLIWLVIATVAFQLWGIERVVRILINLTWASVASVAIFFYLFLTYGPEAVKFLTEEANVYVSGGFAGATILVYGSLIFFSGALFAQPMLIRNGLARLSLLTLLVICALTSGRSALILAIPVGFVVGAILRARLGWDPRSEQRKSVLWPMLGLGLLATLALLAVNYFFFEVNLSIVLGEFVDELMSGGGSVRSEQAGALWEGFLDSWGIGVGHGVGVPYIRNTDYPWRYEIIPLATLLRVGVIGTIIYASTFIIFGIEFLRRLGLKSLSPEDIYMFGGFIAVALAAFTNPYIESFVFQWMYFLPAMSIAVRPLVAPPADRLVGR